MAGELKALECKNCGASISLSTGGRALAVACGACKSIIDPHDPNHRIISQSNSKVKFDPEIPLGRRGEIRGTKFEVVGFMVRCDSSGAWEWSEYLLYNPYKGFCWLVENQGHWSFVNMVKSPTNADIYSENITYEKRSFRRFLRDSAKVIYVIGEFYWQVKAGEETKTCDYIDPPFMLSAEFSEKESVWSIGEYLQPAEVEHAFRPMKNEKPLRLKLPSGVGAHQPSPFRSEETVNIWLAVLVFLILLFLATRSSMDGSGSNFFTGLLALVSWPVWDLLRQQSFEKDRWSNSDNSPYQGSDDWGDEE